MGDGAVDRFGGSGRGDAGGGGLSWGPRVTGRAAVVQGVVQAVVLAVLGVGTVWGQSPATGLPATRAAEAGSGGVSAAGGGGMLWELDDLARALADEGLSQARRDEAARRLVSRLEVGAERERARELLIEALVNVRSRGGQLAVARAFVMVDRPDGVFLAPLNALLSSDRQLTEAASLALTNFGDSPEVRGLLLKFAGSTSVPEVSRLAVVRALGALPEKQVAEWLVGLVESPAESSAMRATAEESLRVLAGAMEGRGLEAAGGVGGAGGAGGPGGETGVRAWWAEASKWTDGEFRQRAESQRSARMMRWKYRYEQLSDEVGQFLAEGYRLVPEEHRAERLLRLLRSSQAAVRAAAVRIALGDALEARAIPAAAREALRQMVGDGSRQVRLEVAWALRSLNDAAALDSLLAQVRRETDVEVRAALVAAMGPIRDMRSLGALLEALGDAPSVATAAAEAIALLGTEIRRDAAVADRVTLRLREVLLSEGVAEDLKAAALEALVPLRRREVLPLAQSMLGSGSSPRVRRAALRLLGELHDPDSAGSIIAVIEDRRAEPGVRVEAVAALGAIPTFEHAEVLYGLLSETAEADALVRSRAWAELTELLALANREQLTDWSARFERDPGRRLVVLGALAAELRNPGDEEALAVCSVELAETLVVLGRPAEAVLPIKDALSIWRSRNAGDAVVVPIERMLLEATLQSRQFAEAAVAGAFLIRTGGTEARGAVEKLLEKVAQLAEGGEEPAARLLLSEVRRTGVDLPESFAAEFAGWEARLQEATTRPAATTRMVSPSTAAAVTRPTTRPAGPATGQ